MGVFYYIGWIYKGDFILWGSMYANNYFWNGLTLALLYSTSILFACYGSKKVMDWWPFKNELSDNKYIAEVVMKRLFSENEEILNEGFLAVIIFVVLILVFIYYSFQIMLRKDINSFFPIIFDVIFWLIFFSPIAFVNVILRRIEDDKDLIKNIANDHTRDFILKTYDRYLELALISFFVVIGYIFVAILNSYKPGAETVFKITFDFLLMFVFILFSFTHLNTYRVIRFVSLLDREIKKHEVESNEEPKQGS